MKNAEEWLDENGYKNTEMWSRQGVYEVAIRLQHDHDNELISEIEKKIEGLKGTSTHGRCCTCQCKHFYDDDECTCKEISALTEIINLIKGT